MGIAMCCYVSQTSFKDLEKSRGQAKAMLDSWVVSTNTSETIEELGTTEYNNMFSKGDLARHVQSASSEHNWVFIGMSGFRDKELNKKIIKS
jgi:hypothetical protein